MICSLAPKATVSMPSQAVDVAWHEFILFTHEYEAFCRRCLGRFLHHTPVQAMRTPTDAQDGIRRAWRIACLREGIDRHKPDRLPMLFALDAELAIPDGFAFVLDCSERPGGLYCAGDIGCAAGCHGGHGGHDGHGGHGDHGCGGHGCGGHGCGGSGCGGD